MCRLDFHLRNIDSRVRDCEVSGCFDRKCRMTRLGGQNSPWLMSAADLADLIDERRERAR
jgi:hypothetical protein